MLAFALVFGCVDPGGCGGPRGLGLTAGVGAGGVVAQITLRGATRPLLRRLYVCACTDYLAPTVLPPPEELGSDIHQNVCTLHSMTQHQAAVL